MIIRGRVGAPFEEGDIVFWIGCGIVFALIVRFGLVHKDLPLLLWLFMVALGPIGLTVLGFGVMWHYLIGVSI